jgi:adenylate cyclase
MSSRTIRQNFLFQIICWTLAANLYMVARFIGLEDYDQFPLMEPMRYKLIFTQATLGGIVVGIILGTIDIFFARRPLRKRSFSFLVLTKGFIYIASIIIVITGVRLVSDLTIDHMNLRETAHDMAIFYQQKFLISLLVCALFVSFFVNFIKQVSQKFGPGILIPMFLGKYYQPKKETRIFMFLDLRDSTTLAEKIGDVKYSELLQDCFYDLATQVEKHEAEIYQYVGDEAVLNWKVKNGIRDFNCLKIYFAFEQRLKSRSEYYVSKYGLIPVFKAGLNGGNVIVAEIGEIKKEIAYHGDVLNTAARIQEQCNAYQKNLLISETLLRNWSSDEQRMSDFIFRPIGSVELKGKLAPVTIHSVETNGS